LTFTSASPLRELLDLPPRLLEPVSIPDSVEGLSFAVERRPLPARTATFGTDSRLNEIDVASAALSILSAVFNSDLKEVSNDPGIQRRWVTRAHNPHSN
jgi:hypothetical protein